MKEQKKEANINERIKEKKHLKSERKKSKVWASAESLSKQTEAKLVKAISNEKEVCVGNELQLSSSSPQIVFRVLQTSESVRDVSRQIINLTKQSQEVF